MVDFTAVVVSVAEGGMVVKYTAVSGMEQMLNLPLPLDIDGNVLIGEAFEKHILTYAPVGSMDRIEKARLKWSSLQAIQGRQVRFNKLDFDQGSITSLPVDEILVDAVLTNQ